MAEKSIVDVLFGLWTLSTLVYIGMVLLVLIFGLAGDLAAWMRG